MKRPQFSIARLMIVVVVVAFNIAATQFWSHSSEPSALTGRYLTFVALQVGLLCLIRSRRTRLLPFWSGFVAFGLVAALVSTYIDFLSPEESALFSLMDNYYFESYQLLQKLPMLVGDPYYRSKIWTSVTSHDGGATDNSLWEIVSFLPHLSIALAGGLFTVFAIRYSGERHNRPSRSRRTENDAEVGAELVWRSATR